MWKSCILAGPENIQLDNESRTFNKLKTELLSRLNKLKFSCTLNNLHEKNAAKDLIDKLIDLGKLDTALRISTIFNYKHKVSIINFHVTNVCIDYFWDILYVCIKYSTTCRIYKF